MGSSEGRWSSTSSQAWRGVEEAVVEVLAILKAHYKNIDANVLPEVFPREIDEEAFHKVEEMLDPLSKNKYMLQELRKTLST